MTTKVLAGGAGQQVQPMVWRRLPAGVACGGGAGGGALSPEPDPGLGSDASEARIAELEREATEREQRAFAAGYRKGENAGQAEASGRLDAAARRLAQAADQLGQARRQLRRDAEEDLVKLAVAIARRILYRELSVDPEAMLGVVKAALDKLDAREVDRLRLHPEDAPAVRKHLEESGALGRFEIVADERLERGAVVFETPRGNLDASTETQLAEIERGLVDRIRR